LRAQDGEIARRIPEPAFVLLERGVVFLVDDDDAELRHRREHRGACAQNHTRLARQALPPRGQTFVVRETGVQDADGYGEPLAEAPDELWRQPDLGHEHQRAAARAQRVLDAVQVDLGLAAAGDAVEQERREAAVCLVDRRDGGSLLGTERRSTRPDENFRRRRRLGSDLGGMDESTRYQRAQRRAPVIESCLEHIRGGALRAVQQLQQFALPRCSRQSFVCQCGDACGRHEPEFGRRDRCRTGTRQLGQSRREHFSHGMVVVLRCPLDELHDAFVHHRLGVEHFEHTFELCRRQFGFLRIPAHHAYQPLRTEGNSYPGADPRNGARVREQVIEQPP
jgi:hypothetical protein